MSVTYTNRKGQTFVLCKQETKTGKPRYVFARQPVGEIVEQIPDGYQIRESVKRTFRAARSYSRGTQEKWLVLSDSGPIEQLAQHTIPKLATNSFDELF